MFLSAMATIKEVARRARVSVGTVSNVLSGTVPVSDKLRERVMQVVRDLDYHPNHVARSLKIRQTKMLGMVVPYLTNPFFPQVVRGAEDVAWRQQLHDADLQLRRPGGARATGARGASQPSRGWQSCWCPPPTRTRRTFGAPLSPVYRSCVSIAGSRIFRSIVSPWTNVTGAQEGVEHLIRAGHRRIAAIAGSLHLEISRERLAGYRRALEAASIPFDEALVGGRALPSRRGVRGPLSG